MAKLTQLSIKRFRNVAPTTLEFRPGLNVLLGKNAAGKTTLLRLLSTVSGYPDKALRDDEMEVGYRASSERLDFEHTIARKRITEPVATPFIQDQGGNDISDIQETSSFVFDEKGGVLTRADLLPDEIVLQRANKSIRVSRRFRGEATLQSVMRSLLNNDDPSFFGELRQKIAQMQFTSMGRMDESLDRFNSLLLFEVRRESRGEHSTYHSELGFRSLPRSMSNALFGRMTDDSSGTFSPTFLEKAAKVLGYTSAEMRFDVERLNPEPDLKIKRLSNLRFFFKRPGEEISHEMLSYGQKRLLAFFAHVDASPDVVIADELVNGLHHEWISACLDEIGERQAFLTSQNPLLLDFLRFENPEEVRRTFILCERGGEEASAQLIWRNPTEDEAESFFSAYQTGIQRVSDILLTKGLW